MNKRKICAVLVASMIMSQNAPLAAAAVEEVNGGFEEPSSTGSTEIGITESLAVPGSVVDEEASHLHSAAVSFNETEDDTESEESDEAKDDLGSKDGGSDDKQNGGSSKDGDADDKQNGGSSKDGDADDKQNGGSSKDEDAEDKDDNEKDTDTDTSKDEDDTFPYLDVAENSKYYDAIKFLWEYGILEEDKYFRPDSTLFMEAAAKAGVMIYCKEHNIELSGEMDEEGYIKRAIEYKLLDEGAAVRKRVETGTMLALVSRLGIPLEPQRAVTGLPDLSSTDPDFDAIISVYRAGVYSGSDELGRLNRNTTVSRGTFASVLHALLDVSMRSTEPVGLKSGIGVFEVEADLENPFTDVTPDSNVYKSIIGMYNQGLANGVTATEFRPKAPIPLSQFAAIAVRVYEKYRGINSDYTAPDGAPWYETYVRKAAEYGLLPNDISGYTNPITRKQAFYVIYRVFPETELIKKRDVYRLPDLSPVDPQYDEVLKLYESGISGGSDEYGTFDGGRMITRAESATLFYRLIRPNERQANQIKLKTGMEAFNIPPANVALPFKDVYDKAWYAEYVKTLYNKGLINGVAENIFSPSGNMNLADAVALSVRIYEYYHGLSASSVPIEEPAGTPWYTRYVTLAKSYGLLDASWTQYNKSATKEQLARLVYYSLPVEHLKEINEIKRIPDVDTGNRYYKEIYALYKAGIISGDEKTGKFNPGSNATRAMGASMFVRLLEPEKRLHFTLKKDLGELQSLVQRVISGYHGTWSVYFCDVETDSDFVVNDKRMWSASVVKLYVMAAVMEALEKGTLSNSSGVQNDLHDMITWSSNTAWSSLYTRLGGGSYSAGRARVNEFCQRNGYKDSGRYTDSAPYNTTSAKDAGLFLRRVLNGTNVSAAASRQMLALLKAQQRTWKIPAGVPSNITTANKTGELFASVPVENDAAIVFSPSGTYILVVLTQGGSISNIRSLSSAIYTYLNS